MDKLSLKDYIIIIGDRIEKAEDTRNVEECLRLASLLQDVLLEYKEKVTAFQESQCDTTS